MQGIQSSPEELEQQLADNQQRVHEAVDSNADITVRDLTEEERAALRTKAVEDLKCMASGKGEQTLLG